MFQYENYLLEKDHLSFEEALEIYTQLLNQMDFEDEDMAELFQDVVEAAVKYVTMRNAWLTFSNEEKKEKDPSRTSLYNAYMATLTPLYRYMGIKEREVAWYEQLVKGDAPRKRLGDFAGYFVCFNGLVTR